MNYDNNATRIRRDLFIRVARLVLDGTLEQEIDRIPLNILPKNNPLRCCIYKDRAVLKYRLMAILGIGVEEETDELKRLGEYAAEVMNNASPATGTELTLIDEACSACVKAKYFVTNACRGCMARPCTLNCPKKAIRMGPEGQAVIDPSLCVNCGICMKVCPYHSIIRIPVPCEEACPVGAIEKRPDGKAVIDFEKCILCGKCMRECPFGAIMEKSAVVKVLTALREGRQLILMLAPAVVGQFVAPFGSIVAAVKEAGFAGVVEVAEGAMVTAENEAAEFDERMEAGESFMTTSCCPAFVESVRKHVPDLCDKVSTTATPLHFTAEKVRRDYPEALSVFVSPCIAKRKEGHIDEHVDFVLTSEELGAIFAAKSIDVAECAPVTVAGPVINPGRGFPVIGGVTEAVGRFVKHPEKLKVSTLDGLTKNSMKLLKIYASKGMPGTLLEGMACEGGCVNGPCTMENPQRAKQRITALQKETET